MNFVCRIDNILYICSVKQRLISLRQTTVMITKESILSQAADMRTALREYEAADAAYQKEYAAFADMWRSSIQFADEFSKMSEQEQELQLASMNRMDDKMQSGV